MITIISATNRPGSNTRRVAETYLRLLEEQGIEAQIFSMEENVFKRSETFIEMETRYLKAADKFIFILPEYNGSYPGILKLMIDNTEVSKVWWGKKALLTGVSSGRAGNLRGMEHLTGALMHMKMWVHPNRLPISSVHLLHSEEGKLTDEVTLKAIKVQLEEFLAEENIVGGEW